MEKKTLQGLSLKNKRVLMRVDFNVPLNAKGEITDETRIIAALPSIRYVLSHGAALILMSHLGRPNKEQNSKEKNSSFSLKPCAKSLSRLLGQPVLLAPDCIGSQVKKMAEDLHPGQVLLLENLRFHAEEEHPEGNDSFVKELASLGDIYINDAFGSSHRSHASIVPITKYFPNQAVAGFLMEKELEFLGGALKNPKRPFCAILGGSKISTKWGVIESLMKKADAILIGGGMTYTFLKAKGIPIGNSIHEDDCLDKAKQLLALSGQNGNGRLILPKDLIVADAKNDLANIRTIKSIDGVPDGYEGVDIGPDTIVDYATELRKAKTVLWNGPVGIFEIPSFAKGTNALAHLLATLPEAITIVGGGDSIAAIQAAGVADKITHLSTGGGASLEYIEFGTLPGIEALS